jgi:hypothetical protein
MSLTKPKSLPMLDDPVEAVSAAACLGHRYRCRGGWLES